MLNQTVRIVDLETTGLRDEDCHICEIAWLDVQILKDANGSYILEPLFAFESLIKPPEAIPPDASAIHHITNNMVADKPSIDYAIKAFNATMPHGRPEAFVSHQKDFELSFLRHHLQPEDLDPSKWLCTWRLSKHVVPEAPSFSNQALRYYFGIEELPPVVDKFNESGVVPHRAMADVWYTAYVMLELYKNAVQKEFFDDGLTIDAVIEAINEPTVLLKCPLGKHRGTPFPEVPTDYLIWMWRKRQEADWDDDIKYTVERELQRRGVLKPKQ